MANESEKAVDVYSDAFTITITPFGANLSFAVREAHPSPAQAQKITHLATVRMSIEHLKVMIAMVRNQIIQAERDTGVRAEVPRSVLNQLHIAPEDWEAFWRIT